MPTQNPNTYATVLPQTNIIQTGNQLDSQMNLDTSFDARWESSASKRQNEKKKPSVVRTRLISRTALRPLEDQDLTAYLKDLENKKRQEAQDNQYHSNLSCDGSYLSGEISSSVSSGNLN